MEKNKKISSVMYFMVFIITVFVLGGLSAYKLYDFYVNDRTDYNEWNAELGNKFETDEASAFFKKFEFVNLNGFIRRILHQQEMNGVVKLNNGYLFTPIAQVGDEVLTDYADRVAKLKAYLDEEGIELLYVQTPYTVSKYDPQIPAGVWDFGNDDADRFITMLKDRNISTMDYRELMHEDGINQYDMMYKTDHHWTTEAGFYAYCKLSDYLQRTLNCKVDERIGDIENYTITTYENWHLGSRGQRTGKYYAGIDDFDLISPDFDIEVRRDKDVGTIRDLVLYTDALRDTDYTFRYTYDSVLQASMDSFICNEAKNDKRILMVTDSFGYALNPYMIMSFAQTRTIRNGETEKLTKEFINEYKPDAVVLMYYPTLLTDGDGGFKFLSEDIQ